jgi:hypothetical protein
MAGGPGDFLVKNFFKRQAREKNSEKKSKG